MCQHGGYGNWVCLAKTSNTLCPHLPGYPMATEQHKRRREMLIKSFLSLFITAQARSRLVGDNSIKMWLYKTRAFECFLEQATEMGAV